MKGLLRTTILAAALAGCQQGGTTTFGTSGPIDLAAASAAFREVGDVGAALRGGSSLTADRYTSVAAAFAPELRRSELHGPVPAGLRLARDGVTMLTLGEEEIRLDRGALGVNPIVRGRGTIGYRVADPIDGGLKALVYGRTGTIDSYARPGNGSAEVLYYVARTVEPRRGRQTHTGYAVIGPRTPVSNLAALSSTAYRGEAAIDLRTAAGFTDNEGQRVRLTGTVNLRTDFSGGVVAGDITGLRLQRGTGASVPVSGTLRLMPARIGRDGGFEAQVSVQVPGGLGNYGDAALGQSLRWSGRLFGSRANEVGGVLRGESRQTNLVGYLHARGAQPQARTVPIAGR